MTITFTNARCSYRIQQLAAPREAAEGDSGEDVSQLDQRNEDAMSTLIDMIKSETSHNGTEEYVDDDIRAVATECHELPGNGLLAVRIEGIHVSFVVFQFASGPATRNGIELPRSKTWSRVFYGFGPSDSLRELRHAYWGHGGQEDGYVFYPSAKLITAAFEKLQTWFDCD